MHEPKVPPEAFVNSNMFIANHRKTVLKPGSAFLYSWFYTQVKNRGPWDYKQISREYEAFGNYNYGATGTAAGIPRMILLRAAGAAQSLAGTSREDLGEWWGSAPYGDDYQDQYWIEQGIAHAKWHGY
ncbi:polymorphic toxin type 44 domain-containing protein [Pseudomonas sp. NA-150]|uniref:polymorphic toxin type 44 domain-containing protein n=1 Tax=Pseudomonas sp. NA-150 TaxID=3367525 RepID=UPI0037CC4299